MGGVEMSRETIEKGIVERILTVEKPSKIILFGSYARGDSYKGSDIDLLVVVDRDDYPKSFQEKAKNYLKISRAVRDIEKEIPIDLLVYTKPEFEMFKKLGSMFFKKIMTEGREIL